MQAVLRLRAYQPQAHYRIPFTYQRRHTYPIPPYSTVIGFLCNILGLPGPHAKDVLTNLRRTQIAIAGTFAAKVSEYLWFRNLNLESHNERFLPGLSGVVKSERKSKNDSATQTPSNHLQATARKIDQTVEHPGSQIPMQIDVLQDVQLWIYLRGEKPFLESIKAKLETPTDRKSPLHLGRAEDWLVLHPTLDWITPASEIPYGNYKKFFWIPIEYAPSDLKGITRHRIATFYQKTMGYRSFEWAEVFLYRGPIYQKIEGLYDQVENIPLFFWPKYVKMS